MLGKSWDNLCHPLVFKKGDADDQDKGDGSNYEETDWCSLNTFACFRGPCVVHWVVAWLLLPLGRRLRIGNHQRPSGSVEEEDENCHGQANLLSSATFWPEVQGQYVRDDTWKYFDWNSDQVLNHTLIDKSHGQVLEHVADVEREKYKVGQPCSQDEHQHTNLLVPN